jgi:hypothetical protein
MFHPKHVEPFAGNKILCIKRHLVGTFLKITQFDFVLLTLCTDGDTATRKIAFSSFSLTDVWSLGLRIAKTWC